jgi:hypothetical protein
MKKVAILTLAVLFVGCAAQSLQPTRHVSTQKEQDCIKNCQFRDSLCTSSCEKMPSRKYFRGYHDDRWSCMDECNRKLQDCYRLCSDTEKDLH